MLTKCVVLGVYMSFMRAVASQDTREITPNTFDSDLYYNSLNPELCQEQLRAMTTFEFYDASFRIPQGILGGNMNSMGNYHQCLGIRQDVGAEDVIEGKYCMMMTYGARDYMSFPLLNGKSWLQETQWMDLDLNSTLKSTKGYLKKLVGNEIGQRKDRIAVIPILNELAFTLAVCIPKTCTLEDSIGQLLNNSIVPINYAEEFCRLSNDKPMVAADYTAIVTFSIIGLLTILSTGYDLWHRLWVKKDPAEANMVLRSFSMYTNTKTFLSFRKTNGAVDCIDGIRSISMAWIIVGHTIAEYLSRYTFNILDFLEWGNRKVNMWVTSAELGVDTFFTLSGLLLVYTAANKMKQMQLLKNLHVFYLNRLLRMFPLLACAVLLQASVFHHVADGPIWNHMAYNVEMCREYWWKALLHIQNLYNPLEYCIPQTWYLSVDVQLHILSPLILFWVLGSRRCAWTGLAVGVPAVLTASTLYIFLKDFDFDGYEDVIYYLRNPLTRSPPFLAGMVFGYILHTFRGKKIRLPIWFVGLGYIVSAVVGGYCFYSFYPMWESDVVISLNWAFVRLAWGISVCWIIFACAQGYGGPINWFLSLKIWKFMARISYAMYLFHYSIIFTITSSRVAPAYFSMDTVFLEFASVMVYTVITSTAACVLIDVPFSILQKMLLTAVTPQSSTKPMNKMESGEPSSVTNKGLVENGPKENVD